MKLSPNDGVYYENVENAVGKGEHAGSQTSMFTFSNQMFERLFPRRCQNVGLCGKEF